MDLTSLGRVVAISPHLDDAVLSVGGLLAATPQPIVVTVFAGYPPAHSGLTEWDASCGFVEGADVVGIRRDEDRRALAHLGGEPRWLDFLDEQYRDVDPSPDDVAQALLAQLDTLEYDTIAFPLGLDHPDHQRTHEGCAVLLETRPELASQWIIWADIPYRAIHQDQLENRIESLRSKGFHLELITFASDERKKTAVNEYTTQFGGLAESVNNAWLPEEFYTVTRTQ